MLVRLLPRPTRALLELKTQAGAGTGQENGTVVYLRTYPQYGYAAGARVGEQDPQGVWDCVQEPLRRTGQVAARLCPPPHCGIHGPFLHRATHKAVPKDTIIFT